MLFIKQISLKMTQVLQVPGDNVQTLPENSTLDDTQCYTKLSFDVYNMCTYNRPKMILELCLCCIGLLNTITIISVFTRPYMRKISMNVLLTALEIANFITMLTRIPSSVLRIACPVINIGSKGSVLIEVANTIFKPTLFFANWITLIIGIWRLSGQSCHFKSAIFRTEENARRIMIPIAVLSIGFGVYVFIYRHTERDLYTLYFQSNDTCYVLPSFKNDNTTENDCMPTSITARNAYLISCTVMTVIPCILAIAVNFWLIVSIFVNALRKRRLLEGQNRTVSISAKTRTTFVLAIYLTAHAICLVCPDLFTLIVYMCPTLSFENAGYFCFLFYNFPAFVYLSLLSLICYCLMSGNFRRTLYQMTFAKLKAVISRVT